jgi:MinD-like ATPase involved in chromosome partitioning or flagellar assembly
MALVCFASFKGSPGATLTALATAAAWPLEPGRRKLLLEADADGGVLALRYQLPARPGLLSLAAAARRGLADDQLWDHAQLLPGGLPVILGPDGPHQATEVLRAGGRDLGRWLRALPHVDVIADVGRLSIGSAANEVAAEADCLLGVARPVAAQLGPAAQRLSALANHGLRVGWVLIGDRPYSAAEVQRAYGLPVIHVIEEDNRGAQQMEAGTNPAKLRRSTLVRSVASLAGTLSGWAVGSSAPPSNRSVSTFVPLGGESPYGSEDLAPEPAWAPPGVEEPAHAETGPATPSLAILAAQRRAAALAAASESRADIGGSG